MKTKLKTKPKTTKKKKVVKKTGGSRRKQAKKAVNARTLSFDGGWRFLKGNPPGAEKPDFDDSKWRPIDLPHDWSIEDLPDQNEDSVIGPFSKASIGKMHTGYTVGGTGWYRKKFTIDRADKDKMVYLQFDGIYMNADVWINGTHIGNHPYGYISFYYDITRFLHTGKQPNTIAVSVKNEGRNTRWYSGSGIYRHVWLTMVNQTHIGLWGTFVTTPVVSDKSADVSVFTMLVNSRKENVPVTLQTEIFDPKGKCIKTEKDQLSLSPDQKKDYLQKVTLKRPALWSTEKPNLYQAKVTLLINNKKVDRLSTTFGIRSIHIDAQSGFKLNGKSMKLRGGCIHHDHGPLGAASLDRAEERKIELLKKAGFNAVRLSHNPPSPFLLDVCDRMGMLVINELYDIWEKEKVSPDDFSKYFKDCWKQDVQAWVIRDRNHPSIIMWSIGNEIEGAAEPSALTSAENLISEIRRLDPTRAVTEAMNDLPAFITGKATWDDQAPHMNLLDAVGYNYMFEKYESDHEKFPDRVIYAGEFMMSFALINEQMAEKHPYVIGNFIWTAMDYLGEAGIGMPRSLSEDLYKKYTEERPVFELIFNPESWPVFNSFTGEIDLIGNRKAPSFYQHVVWRESNVEMLVHQPVPADKKELAALWSWPDEIKSWSWPGHEGQNLLVHVYTRSQTVKLELNGKLIGEQTVDQEKSITATFEVPYEPGKLTARCFDNGRETASETLKTVGKPAAVRLTADRKRIKTDRNDLSYVSADIVDAKGKVIPYADDFMLDFQIKGKGAIAGVGNGNPCDMTSFQQPSKKAYHGKCLAIVRPNGKAGKIVLKAKADGLKQSTVVINTK